MEYVWTEERRGRQRKSRYRLQDARQRDWVWREDGEQSRWADVWGRPHQDQWNRG